MKRVFDLVVAAAAVALLAPLMLAVGIAVRLGLGKPVWFVQERPGRHGGPVPHDQVPHHARRADAERPPAAGRERLTDLGEFLRTSQPRRAAGALERAARRHEPRRAATAADGVPAALQRRGGAPPRGAARHHRLGPGERPQRAQLGREVPARRLVRRSPRSGWTSRSWRSRFWKSSSGTASARAGMRPCRYSWGPSQRTDNRAKSRQG